MEKITAHLIGNKITSNSKAAVNLQFSQNFGKRNKDSIVYMLVETIYLREKGIMEVFDLKDKKIRNKKLLRKFIKIDKDVILKYNAYKNLRERGYIPKTALKYGADFRVYEKKSGHSKWICFVASERKGFTWQEFSSKNRVAHSTKKNFLIAIVDEENDLTYYEVNWKRL